MKTLPAQVRWLIRRDMDEVMEIEKRSFDHPWSEEEFLCHLRERNTIGAVIEDHESVLGYMVYQLHKSKLVLLNLAVKPIERRSGYGRQMIQRLIDKLEQQRRTAIECTVCEQNLNAQLFLQSCGFKASRVIKDAWNGADAYLFRYRLKERACQQK